LFAAPKSARGCYPALALLALIGVSGTPPAVAVQAAAPAAPRYTILDLGYFGNSFGVSASAINEGGQVAGVAWTPGGPRSFRTGPNEAIDLATDLIDNGVAADGEWLAQDLNDAGQVVGYANLPFSEYPANLRSFRTQPNQPIHPGTDMVTELPSDAFGINASGQVIGTVYRQQYLDQGNHGYYPRTFRTGPNQRVSLPSNSLGEVYPDAGGTVSPADINDAGQVTGQAYLILDGYSRAFRLQSGQRYNESTLLGTLGGEHSYGTAINNLGQVAGASYVSAGHIEAFCTRPNRSINPATDRLGTLGGNYSWTIAVNDRGQVTGTSRTADGRFHAFLWEDSNGNEQSDPGEMIDLNSVLPANSGWELTAAGALNEKGQIVVHGTYQGQRRAAVLMPETCPSWQVVEYYQRGLPPAVPTHFGDRTPAGQPVGLTADHGCALCATTSLLTSFTDLGLGGLTPFDLDINLWAQGGYAPKTALLRFDHVPAAVTAATGATIRFYGSRDINRAALDEYLEEFHCAGNGRIILQLRERMRNLSTGEIRIGPHYVAVLGRAVDAEGNTDWKLFDPGWQNSDPPGATKTLSGHLAEDGFVTASSTSGVRTRRTFTVAGVRVFGKTTDSESLTAAAFSPVELLVTDPAGRRVGRNPTDEGDLYEGPESSYFRDFPLASDSDEAPGPSAGGDPHGTKTAHLVSPVPGLYTVEATGTALGTFTLVLRGTDRNGQASETRFFGVTDAGEKSTYHVRYRSELGAPLAEVVHVPTLAELQRGVQNGRRLTLIKNDGVARSLLQKLDAAARAGERQNNLRAFLLEVNAQSGKHIDSQLANLLITDGTALLK
jgi:probable HAF family extracellular repeat protein